MALRSQLEADIARLWSPTPDAEAIAEFARVIEQAAAVARQNWPDVAVTERELLAALVAGGHTTARGPTELARMHLADLHLAQACAVGHAAALAAFERTCIEALDRPLTRLGASSDVISEVKQRLRVRLLLARGTRPPAIADFAGEASLRGWLRVIAVRELGRLARAHHRESSDGGVELERQLRTSLGDVELTIMQAHHLSDVEQCLAQALAELDTDARVLLKQQLLDGLTLDQLAALHRINRATVSRRLARARMRVVTDTKRLLHERLGARMSEIDGLVRMIRSRLHISLDRVLGDDLDGG